VEGLRKRARNKKEKLLKILTFIPRALQRGRAARRQSQLAGQIFAIKLQTKQVLVI
jgi:hypothetical protein